LESGTVVLGEEILHQAGFEGDEAAVGNHLENLGTAGPFDGGYLLRLEGQGRQVEPGRSVDEVDVIDSGV
jgi:hypothetical protein